MIRNIDACSKHFVDGVGSESFSDQAAGTTAKFQANGTDA